MSKTVDIRLEQPNDYQQVEMLIRQSFYNIYMPGCVEHYLAHILRSHADFLPELDFVLTADDKIIGTVMYTKARLVDEAGQEKEILTFGPLCIAPEYQRQGYGKQLLEHSFEKAIALGYDTIVIFGDPANYVSRGFKSCKRYHVCLENGTYPAAMLVKELNPGVLSGKKWIYHQSPAFDIDPAEAERFDATLEPMEKKELPCQESFYILSNAVIGE